jgi:hypothetical protein
MGMVHASTEPTVARRGAVLEGHSRATIDAGHSATKSSKDEVCIAEGEFTELAKADNVPLWDKQYVPTLYWAKNGQGNKTFANYPDAASKLLARVRSKVRGYRLALQLQAESAVTHDSGHRLIHWSLDIRANSRTTLRWRPTSSGWRPPRFAFVA